MLKKDLETIEIPFKYLKGFSLEHDWNSKHQFKPWKLTIRGGNDTSIVYRLDPYEVRRAVAQIMEKNVEGEGFKREPFPD